jgi:hypothetical protein
MRWAAPRWLRPAAVAPPVGKESREADLAVGAEKAGRM